ncbi:MAG: metal-binding protein [Erythrobacter sp.]|nr:metal-binding protein [Erythrobacter sp.]
MRKLVLALALFSTPALAAGDILMHRDPGCGCCEQWAARVRQAFGRNVRIVDDANRTAFQRQVGLPANLVSCHTAIVDGIAFEGHIPIADMRRVLASRPKGVRGLAVAGMPIGSPGMEVPGVRAQRYNVIAFGAARTSVYAQH